MRYIQGQESLLFESASILSIEPKILPKTARRFFNEWKEQKKTIEDLNKQIAELQFSPTKIQAERIKGIDVIVKETTGNQKELIVQAAEAVKSLEKGLCILVSKQEKKILIVGSKTPTSDLDISGIVQEMSTILGGSGGGKGDIAIGGGPKTDKLPEVLEKANRIIESKI